jgi:Protein of unknown function (DUF2628)
MAHLAEINDTENPFRPGVASLPVESLPVEAPVVIPATVIDELRAFVGPSANYYLKAWDGRLRNPAADVPINWAAFLFPTFWFSYRKMYRQAVLVYAIGLAVSSVALIVFMGMLGTQRAPFAIGRLAIGLVCGRYANAWYLSRALRAISTAQEQGLDHDERMLVLPRRGGTNILAVFGMFLPFLAWMAIVCIAIVVITVGR